MNELRCPNDLKVNSMMRTFLMSSALCLAAVACSGCASEEAADVGAVVDETVTDVEETVTDAVEEVTE